MNIKRLLQPYQAQVITVRRDLHQIPELGYTEEKTSAYVADYLQQQGLSVTTGIARTGVVGLLDSGRPGPTLLIRADMDALPISEETGLAYASQHPGVMHACGHDGHTAMALVAAKILVELKDQLNGTVKFVFQPAEEGPGGAKPMIEAGVMENPHVDYALGCHIWPTIPQGTIGIRAGALMAAASRFKITITGKGGHGAQPHLCVDALETGCQVVAALQRIVSRKMNPLAPTVVTIGRFEAGTAFNVIPETAHLLGTARTFDLDTWQRWPEIIETIVKGVCDAMGARFTCKFVAGYPPTVNDPEMAMRMERIAAQVVGADRAIVPEKSMGGEDMAFFLERAKGCFFCLGAGTEGSSGIHSPHFTFNEEILISGVEMYCRAALDLLGENTA
ncbi:putative amidohydrolase YhaA [Desulfosarcina cetonica]|uniref:M20 metallopeptidase family protein n=1 Tax=Desulfosarcina cetonica TaxID=90730 RepID=UPI0009F9CB01|nr:amidohydrolase [Desulfosarcina cetonica]VTR68089.1 putative amidohydrolase YhaA [Desulfosarcina cetonica]